MNQVSHVLYFAKLAPTELDFAEHVKQSGVRRSRIEEFKTKTIKCSSRDGIMRYKKKFFFTGWH